MKPVRQGNRQGPRRRRAFRIRRARSQRAVTLLETVLAIVILSASLLATTALVPTGFFDRTAARAAAGDVVGILQAARREAMVKRCAVHISLTGRSGAQRILVASEPNRHDSGRQQQWSVDPNVSITATPVRLTFLANGHAQQAAAWQVDGGGQQRIVRVQMAGGRILPWPDAGPR